MDAAWIALAGVAFTGIIALIGTLAARRLSSPSETQTALNESFKNYMTATDKEIKDLKTKHRQCEARTTLLRRYIATLIRVLRKHGIPVPLLEEEPAMLESRSFGNGPES